MVGKKEYPYTPKGIAMAKAAAKKKGTKMKMKKGYAKGGKTYANCGASVPPAQGKKKK